MKSDDADRTVAIRLQRLAVGIPKEDVPTFEEVGLTSLVSEATNWQILRGHSWFWGWSDMLGMPTARWLEIGELFGSTGESVCLAAAAQIEIEILRRAIERRSVDGFYGISQRFFAEAQGMALLGVGHRLANLIVRVLMTDSSYPWGLRLKKLRTAFPTQAKGKEHWIELARADDLLSLAKASSYQSMRRMAEALVSLRLSEQWRKLEEQRGVDFHRWRAESPFVAKAVYSEQPGARSLSVMGSPKPNSPESREFIGSVCSASRGALDQLLPTLVEIREAWLLAMEELSTGAFTWKENTPHITPRGQSSD
jgi:hypothetical protein